MSALPIDRAMMTTFIGALFRYADEGTFISIRAFLDHRDGTWGAERCPGQVAAIELAPQRFSSAHSIALCTMRQAV
jgi:hypothetical protein